MITRTYYEAVPDDNEEHTYTVYFVEVHRSSDGTKNESRYYKPLYENMEEELAGVTEDYLTSIEKYRMKS